MQVKKKPKKTAKAVPEKSRKKKQPSEDQIKKQPFLKRMLFGEEKPDLSELEAGSTTILDILSPTTVDTKSRDYIIVDDVYHAYLYTHIATVPRMKGERIIWISESNSFGEINLPRHHFFAVRQEDGTHRFFGSNEPGKI